MNICQTIVKYGTEAVLRYRDAANLRYDNEVPEIYLGGFIAGGIYSHLNANVHVERYYADILKEFNISANFDVNNIFGRQRADLAIYQNSAPKAIVELKIFADRKSAGGIVADRDKMAKLSALCPIATYLGILVTDTENEGTYIERIKMLEEALGHEIDLKGCVQRSAKDEWNWCFVSARTGQQRP